MNRRYGLETAMSDYSDDVTGYPASLEDDLEDLDASMFAPHPAGYLCRCGAVHAGRPGGCTCPSDFPAHVVADLRSEVERLTKQLDLADRIGEDLTEMLAGAEDEVEQLLSDCDRLRDGIREAVRVLDRADLYDTPLSEHLQTLIGDDDP